MKHTRNSHLFALIAAGAMFSSCQQAVVDGDSPTGGQEEPLVNFRLRVTQLENQPFEISSYAGRSSSIASLCTHVSLAMYQNGKRVSLVNQTAGEKDFGTLAISVPAGDYQMVVLAYGNAGTVSMAHAEKITFDGKLSDTFCFSDSVHLADNTSEDLVLKRVAAMFKLVTTDSIPTQVHAMQFAYTGGSSTLDGIRGEGCVQSRQKETLVVTGGMKGKPGTFTVYTFPRQGSNSLKMTVSALDANGKVLVERNFPSIAIHRNVVTQYKGRFFTGIAGDTPADSILRFRLVTNDEWGETDVDF